MPYVQREAGKIVGVYELFQSYAQEELAEDDAEVRAYRERDIAHDAPTVGSVSAVVGASEKPDGFKA